MNRSNLARLLLIDDHPLVRDGLRARLEAESCLHVVGEAGNGSQALERAAALRPDLALVDFSMPDMDGPELVARMRDAHPDTACLILSMFDKPEYVRQAVRAGARGYVLKDSPSVEIVAAINAVLAGSSYYSASLTHGLASMTAAGDQLTEREREILDLVASGSSNKRIAQLLGISCRTVETHRLSVRRKLGIASTAGLVKFALEQM